MERRHSTHYPVIVAHRLHIGCNYGRMYMLRASQTISIAAACRTRQRSQAFFMPVPRQINYTTISSRLQPSASTSLSIFDQLNI